MRDWFWIYFSLNWREIFKRITKLTNRNRETTFHSNRKTALSNQHWIIDWIELSNLEQYIVQKVIHSFFLFSTNVWAVCPPGYFLQGLFRNTGAWLHHIEEATCCKPQTLADEYQDCYFENIWYSFDRKGIVKCNRNGYYLAGIYKGGCDQLHCIELLFCCKMMTGKGSYMFPG